MVEMNSTRHSATMSLESSHISNDELVNDSNFVNMPQSSDVEVIIEPHVGMEFNSMEKVKHFYTLFAKAKGFGIRTRSSKKDYCILVCVNEGENKVKSDNIGQLKKHCSTIRSGCQASLCVSKDKKQDVWVIKAFDNNHNHVMASPKSVSYMRCHKKMNGVAKSLVEKFKEEGIPTGKVATMFDGSDLAFSNRDCWNHLRNLRRKNLDIGDAQSVFKYCRQKQSEDSEFFFAIQCDDDDRMINFFWVDSRLRLAYQHFGDVITFDTTYRTNKYSMPFAPFTGVNHHLQSILFGCALLQDESENSFIWLFETWLEAMNGKKPISIITYQDLAIGAAVAKIFPETRHRLCLWHIGKKFPEKLAHVYHKNSAFKRELKRCIRESKTVKDFEDDWPRLILEYNLQENEWLGRLFEIRESWIPVYNRSTFFAGMNTTQRSESINAFFDSFVNATTTLQDFVIKFEKAVNNRYEAEKREDFDSRYKARILSIGSKFEEQAASFYTKNVFRKFYDELAKVSHFTKEKIEKNGSQSKYKISSYFHAQDSFIVDINMESKTATCSCQLFEFIGILCRHILAIFQAKDIIEIPNRYILNRWTKEANKYIHSADTDIQNHETNVLRSMHVQRQFAKFCELAKRSEEAYKFIMTEFDRIYNMATTMDNVMVDVNEASQESDHQVFVTDTIDDASNVNIQDPHVSHTKGRRRNDSNKMALSGRFKSGLELSVNKLLVKRRACKCCRQYGHYQSTCKQKTT